MTSEIEQANREAGKSWMGEERRDPENACNAGAPHDRRRTVSSLERDALLERGERRGDVDKIKCIRHLSLHAAAEENWVKLHATINMLCNFLDQRK